MLRDKDAMATVAVTDLAVAKDFYGGALGLEASGEGMAAWFTDPDGNILHVNNQ